MITDSSVLILHARARHLSLLRHIFSTLHAPPAVVQEAVNAKPDAPDAERTQRAIHEGWIVETEPPDDAALESLTHRYTTIGEGEKAAIALAVGRDDDDILMDDHEARQAARLEGLRPVGSLGVLARAYGSGVLEDKHEVQAVLRDLLAAGAWLHPEVLEAFWSRLDGRP